MQFVVASSIELRIPMQVQPSKAAPMRQDIITFLRGSSDGQETGQVHKEKRYLKHALGGMNESRPSSAMTVMRNFCIIPFYYLKI